MTELPPEVRAAVQRLVAASGMAGAARRELKDDLAGHARDALDAGRTPAEVVERLGRTEDVGPLLRRSAPPSTRRPDATSREGFARGLATDLRYGLRTLVRAPVTASIVVLVLAVGIGANTAVLTAVNEIFLRPLPVADQGSLVDVWADVEGGNSFAGFGWRDVEAYQEASSPLESLAAFAGVRATLGEVASGTPVVAQLVSREYMPMMGVDATLGSLDFGEDAGPGAPLTAILSHALWTEHFGGDRRIVGRDILLDGHPVTVVGVGPEGFTGHFIGFPVDLWLPLTAADPFLPGFDPEDRASMPFEMIGRLRQGATPQMVEAALEAVARRLETQHPDTHRGHGIGVTATSGLDHALHGAVRAFVTILVGASGLVLLIACLNVGSILLARILSREGEMAVRLAIGAGNGRLVRQMLAESAILSALGALLGILGALLLNALVADLFRSVTAGLGLELEMDGRVLALTAAVAAVAVVLVAAAPALHLLRKEPATALRAGVGRSRGAGARAILVTAQVTASMVLITGAGLLARALISESRVDPGYDIDGVASFAMEVEVGSPSSTSTSPSSASNSGRSPGDGVSGDRAATLRAVVEELRRVPGVESVTWADAPPSGVARSPVHVAVPGMESPRGDDGWVVDARRVGSGYLSTLGIPLRSGRDVRADDVREGRPVAIASRAFVDRLWPGSDPVVGRALVVDGTEVRVVGVAEDVRYLVQDPRPDPFLYLALEPEPPAVVTVVLRGEPAIVGPSVRAVVGRHLPGHPPPRVRSPEESFEAALLPQRLGVAIVGAMGLAALLLAGVGLYGLIQYTVTRDRRDLAVRRALGGSRGRVLAVVVRRGVLLVLAGVLAGGGLAALAAPALSGFLAGVSPTDPLTYSVVALTFLAVGFFASWLPARGTLRIDPAESLRVG